MYEEVYSRPKTWRKYWKITSKKLLSLQQRELEIFYTIRFPITAISISETQTPKALIPQVTWSRITLHFCYQPTFWMLILSDTAELVKSLRFDTTYNILCTNVSNSFLCNLDLSTFAPRLFNYPTSEVEIKARKYQDDMCV